MTTPTPSAAAMKAADGIAEVIRPYMTLGDAKRAEVAEELCRECKEEVEK